MNGWASATSPVQYAIVKPAMPGYGKVIALMTVTPRELDIEYRCVILMGYYRVAVGELMAYRPAYGGGFEEALIESTLGT